MPSPASVFVRRYPLIVAVGSVVGIPVNLAVDALLRGAAFGGAQVGGTLLVMGAFFLMVLPDDMANAVTPACCKPAHVERAAGAAGGGSGRAYAAVRNGAGRLQSAKAVLSAAAEGGGAADGVRHALPNWLCQCHGVQPAAVARTWPGFVTAGSWYGTLAVNSGENKTQPA